ncbi:FUSC family protein [Amycolatopsis sp. WAC 01376]|uniref:FUSC family protein n=1 Tax=Amycolatopsis sp. WAC 01376 TaxID=2203195 RepID=UPI001F29F3F2|nr:FUSC family protein [Amycolatopsis sp. WAC 01376]
MHAVRPSARLPAGLGFAEGDWLHACRVAVGLLVPGLALLFAGRPELIIFAAFGSFAGMYGRAESRGLRLRHQAQGGAILLTGVAVGTLLSACHARPWVLVVTEAGFAFAGALVTNRLDLVPRGPFFGIFALGAIALVPADGAGLSICAGTVLFCVLIGLTGPKRVLGRSAISPPGVTCGQEDCERGRRRSCAVVHAARYVAAISAAGFCGLLLGVEHANWAMASAAVPLAAVDARNRLHPGVRSVLHRSAHRVLGTFAGLGVTALLLLPDFSETLLALSVIALLFPTELFMSRHYGLALGFFTPLIMVMTELATPAEPVPLLTDRVLDTLIGLVAGIAAAVLVRGPCRDRPVNVEFRPTARP